MYKGDGSAECQEFWRQIERAKGVYRPNRTLNFFVEEHDPHASLLGARGIGELGAVGVAPAILNAVYHATGQRVRDLPIRIERVLQ